MFSANNQKMFCKVCYDAGKPEWEYTSHYVKDQPGPNGKVVCPVILNIECNYCHEKGHTPSHCPKLKERNMMQSQHYHQPQTQHYYQPQPQHYYQPQPQHYHTPPQNPPVYDLHGPRCQPRRTQRKRLDLNTKPKQQPTSSSQSFNLKNFYDILEKTMQESRASSPKSKPQQQDDFPKLTEATKPKAKSKTTPNTCWGKKMTCDEMTNHLRSLILKHTPKQETTTPLKSEEEYIAQNNENIDILSETDDNCSDELEYSSEEETQSQSSTNSFVFKKSWADIMEEEERAANEVLAF